MTPVGQFLLMFFIFLHTVVSEETDLNEVFIVSTTQRPSEAQSVADRLKLEFQLDKLVIDKLEMMLEDRLVIFRKEIENNKIKHDETGKELVILKKSKVLMEEQLADAKKEISELRNRKLSLDAKIDILQRRISDNEQVFHKDLKNSNVRIDEMDKQLADLKESKSFLEEQLTDAKKEINELKNSKVTLQEQVEKAKKDISELMSSKVSLNTQIQSIQGRIGENKAQQIEEQKNQIRKVSTKIQNLQEQVMEYNLPKDCKEIQKNDFKFSGVYRIKPESSSKSFKVWCDMETRDGGWIYFLNRFDGSVDFNLNWNDYKQGFGNPCGELWLGLENLYQLTGSQAKELLIELVDWKMKKVYAHYKKFSVGNEEEGYFLKTLEKYSGDAGNDFIGHLNATFSTKDLSRNTTCASFFEAGWWYRNCYHSLLTGKYHNETSSISHLKYKSGINCASFHGYAYSLKEARMMVR